MKRINPDKVIEALERVCERFGVTIDCRRWTGDVILYDKNGAEVCSFKGLTAHDGPRNLEIGAEYKASYNTGSADRWCYVCDRPKDDCACEPAEVRA